MLLEKDGIVPVSWLLLRSSPINDITAEKSGIVPVSWLLYRLRIFNDVSADREGIVPLRLLLGNSNVATFTPEHVTPNQVHAFEVSEGLDVQPVLVVQPVPVVLVYKACSATFCAPDVICPAVKIGYSTTRIADRMRRKYEVNDIAHRIGCKELCTRNKKHIQYIRVDLGLNERYNRHLM